MEQLDMESVLYGWPSKENLLVLLTKLNSCCDRDSILRHIYATTICLKWSHAYHALKPLKPLSRRLTEIMISFVLQTAKSTLPDITMTTKFAKNVMKIVNHAPDLIITIVWVVLKDSRKTGQVLRRALSTVFKTAPMEVMEAMRAFVNHAMKIAKPVLDLTITTAWIVLKERKKIEQVLRRIQSIVLVLAHPDFIHSQRAFACHAMKIAKLVQDRIAITAILVPKERSKTIQVL